MNGTGTSSSRPSPIATAKPESTTVRPAVAIVRATASSRVAPPISSSRKRWTMSSE